MALVRDLAKKEKSEHVSSVGVLFIHGFTGAPASMKPLIDAVTATGRILDAPLLPGHGTNPVDLSTRTFAEFLAASNNALDVLVEQVASVVLIGLSMGGTLAASLATSRGEVAGLVLVNPFLQPPDPSFIDLLQSSLAAGVEFSPSIRSDICDPSVDEGGYDQTPIAPLVSLLHATGELYAKLASISCPVLLFESRVDHVVPALSAVFLAEVVKGPIETVILEDSYHVATLDYDQKRIEELTLSFLDTVGS